MGEIFVCTTLYRFLSCLKTCELALPANSGFTAKFPHEFSTSLLNRSAVLSAHRILWLVSSETILGWQSPIPSFQRYFIIINLAVIVWSFCPYPLKCIFIAKMLRETRAGRQTERQEAVFTQPLRFLHGRVHKQCTAISRAAIHGFTQQKVGGPPPSTFSWLPVACRVRLCVRSAGKTRALQWVVQVQDWDGDEVFVPHHQHWNVPLQKKICHGNSMKKARGMLCRVNFLRKPQIGFFNSGEN